jgi:hypothetical protein
MSDPDPVAVQAQKVGDEIDADVLLYNGEMRRPHDDTVIDLCSKRRRRKNVALVLSTNGGDMDAAYRIARCLRRRYEVVTAIVAGFCKSAGTLLLLGADELVLMEHAELGPLDVQLSKEDSLGERSSGLTPTQAFLSLDSQSQFAFEQAFYKMKLEMNMSTRTAGEFASKIIGSLYGNIYAQIDPIRVGEVQRAQNIANAYGSRLLADSGCASSEALTRLLVGYPTHDFVIDAQEAETLFSCRAASEAEEQLATLLHNRIRVPIARNKRPDVRFLNPPLPEPATTIQSVDAQQAAAAAPAAPAAASAASGIDGPDHSGVRNLASRAGA